MWIETSILLADRNPSDVTPHVGVWIETLYTAYQLHWLIVTPHVGVWIETKSSWS